jgi:hypothetical protein
MLDIWQAPRFALDRAAREHVILISASVSSYAWSDPTSISSAHSPSDLAGPVHPSIPLRKDQSWTSSTRWRVTLPLNPYCPETQSAHVLGDSIRSCQRPIAFDYPGGSL